MLALHPESHCMAMDTRPTLTSPECLGHYHDLGRVGDKARWTGALPAG
jgi:hypothetical protein